MSVCNFLTQFSLSFAGAEEVWSYHRRKSLRGHLWCYPGGERGNPSSGKFKVDLFSLDLMTGCVDKMCAFSPPISPHVGLFRDRFKKYLFIKYLKNECLFQVCLPHDFIDLNIPVYHPMIRADCALVCPKTVMTARTDVLTRPGQWNGMWDHVWFTRQT